MKRTVVIVGAGHAGGRAAQALRRMGFAGSITLVGDEPNPPYERPALSKDFLLGRVASESLFLLDAMQWNEIDVELRLGVRVTQIDRATRVVLLDDGSRLEYEHLVIATGARARRFPGIDAHGERLHYLRTIGDAERLRSELRPGSSLAVVGAGFVGLELAASATQLGTKVKVIESAARPLPRLLPTGIGRWLLSLHAAHGVDVRLGRQVALIDGEGILLDDGERIVADCVAIGIGAQPNLELAQAAGLVERDGVVVDEACRTSDPAIFAIGDVSRRAHPLTGTEMRLESWRNAEDQAQRVACVLCGVEPARDEPPWFWSDQYGRNLQLAGWPDDSCELVEFGEVESGPYLCYYLRDSILAGVVGVDCGREVRGAQQLIRERSRVDRSALRGPRVRQRKQVAVG